jgi:3-oxoadipate enol-lactonase
MNTVTANGVSLAYEQLGAGDETIAFLNGIAMSINHWKPIAEPLASDYSCLLHDFRGQLLSEKPAGPYSLEQHADDTAALFEALGTGPAHVVGTSYGAEIAMVLAYTHPKSVKSLVLVDGVSETSPVLCAAVHSWRSAALVDPVVFYRTLMPWNYSAGYLVRHGEELRDRESVIAGLPPEYFAAFAELCDAFLAIDITRHLPEIDAPTLVIVGERDILKPRRFSEIIAGRIENARLEVVDGAGHAVVIEQPGKIKELVRRFLRELA